MGKISKFTKAAGEVVAGNRLKKVAPSIRHYPVKLAGKQRSSLFTRILGCVPLAIVAVPFFGTSAFAQKVNVKVNHWLGKDSDREQNRIMGAVTESKFEYMLAAHTNNAHTNAAGMDHHTNSAEKHVDVPTEFAHADLVRPHTDSHMNTTHTNSPHENVVTPDTGSEGA
jgi:hypothetical protein